MKIATYIGNVDLPTSEMVNFINDIDEKHRVKYNELIRSILSKHLTDEEIYDVNKLRGKVIFEQKDNVTTIMLDGKPVAKIETTVGYHNTDFVNGKYSVVMTTTYRELL